jgi:phospholipase/carboxylesterase
VTWDDDDLPTAASQGRLESRPLDPPPVQDVAAGEQPLGLDDTGRDGVLYVPPTYEPGQPAPLVLCLHGAGGAGARSIIALRELADEHGMLLIGPDARRQTWDVLLGGYGADVAFIDRALASVFSRFNVDPSRIAIEGFSDGASYALSLGIANGDVFTHILAFSPGFMAPPMQVDLPRIFVSHGTEDRVLPIDRCSRLLTPILRRAGYDVTYQEFDGPHTVPAEIARQGVAWFLERGGEVTA